MSVGKLGLGLHLGKKRGRIVIRSIRPMPRSPPSWAGYAADKIRSVARTRCGSRLNSSIFLEQIDFGRGRSAADLICELPSVRSENFRIANDIVEFGFVL